MAVAYLGIEHLIPIPDGGQVSFLDEFKPLPTEFQSAPKAFVEPHALRFYDGL
jgi:hypothetical protein